MEEAGRRLLMIPYTADHNDHRFATAPGFDWGEPFFAYLRDAFDVLYEEGASQPGMMSIGLHSRLVGRPGRFAALRRFVDHVLAHDPRLALPRHRHRPPLAGPGGHALTWFFVRDMVE